MLTRALLGRRLLEEGKTSQQLLWPTAGGPGYGDGLHPIPKRLKHKSRGFLEEAVTCPEAQPPHPQPALQSPAPQPPESREPGP